MDVAGEFRRFMACVTKVEDLHKLGGCSLADFQQNIEAFRTDSCVQKSTAVAKVVAAAPSARLTKYLDAGGRDEAAARLVASKLDVALKGLWTHINQVRALLAELESLVETAKELMQMELSSEGASLVISPPESEEDVDEQQVLNPSNSSKELPGPSHSTERRLRTSDYAHMMSLILTMLEEDFTMQEKVVQALQLDTTSAALQGYSLMWTLRPFVNDSVIEQALHWIK